MDMEWLHQDNLRDSQRITVNSKISNMIWIQPISNNGQGEKGIYGRSIESKQIGSKVKSYGWRQKRFETKWASTQSITGATGDSQDVQENVDDVQIEMAKMYSSGEIEYLCLPPSISCVSKTR